LLAVHPGHKITEKERGRLLNVMEGKERIKIEFALNAAKENR